MTLIDQFLPVFQFRERHHLLVDAVPAALLDAAMCPDTINDPLLKTFIRLRELPGRLLGSLGMRGTLKDQPAFGLANFTFLGRDSDREIAFGLVGEFWHLDYGLVPISGPTEFHGFAASGVPKLVLNFSVETVEGNHVRFATETRVFCNDRRSFNRFLPYWWIIRAVSGLMRRRLLNRIRDASIRSMPNAESS